MIQQTIEKLWYEKISLRWLLWPLSIIYQIISIIRRHYLINFKRHKFNIPIIVVGNITVGGVGKTPLVIALAQALMDKGLRVGVISRGYGAKIKQFPHEVKIQDTAQRVGDEPLLMARKLACPVVIAPKRVRAVQYLLQKYQCEVIISDDGLQHYALDRAIEIVVVDESRRFGNGLCLPAGPLREPQSRLKTVDFIIHNGEGDFAYKMTMQASEIVHLVSGNKILDNQLQQPVAAVAGIGNPRRFFNTLNERGIKFKAYAFPDHYQFKANDFYFSEPALIMTEKDAVKCYSFAKNSWYFLPVEAKLNVGFWQAFWMHEQIKGYLR